MCTVLVMVLISKATKKLTTKFISAKFQKVDPDEPAHYELPHLNLCCVYIQLLSFSDQFEYIRQGICFKQN